MVPILPKKNFFLGSPARPELFTRMRGPSEKSYPYGFAQGDWPNWPFLSGPGPGPTQLLMSGSVWGVDYTQNTPFSILSSMVKVPSRNSRFRKNIFWPLLIFFVFLGNLKFFRAI